MRSVNGQSDTILQTRATRPGSFEAFRYPGPHPLNVASKTEFSSLVVHGGDEAPPRMVEVAVLALAMYMPAVLRPTAAELEYRATPPALSASRLLSELLIVQ